MLGKSSATQISRGLFLHKTGSKISGINTTLANNRGVNRISLPLLKLKVQCYFSLVFIYFELNEKSYFYKNKNNFILVIKFSPLPYDFVKQFFRRKPITNSIVTDGKHIGKKNKRLQASKQYCKIWVLGKLF